MYEFNVNHGKDDDFLHYELNHYKTLETNQQVETKVVVVPK